MGTNLPQSRNSQLRDCCLRRGEKKGNALEFVSDTFEFLPSCPEWRRRNLSAFAGIITRCSSGPPSSPSAEWAKRRALGCANPQSRFRCEFTQSRTHFIAQVCHTALSGEEREEAFRDYFSSGPLARFPLLLIKTRPTCFISCIETVVPRRV